MELPVRRRRKDLGLSVEQAAAAAKITVSAWYKLEVGARKPSWRSMTTIAEALQWTPEDLLHAVICTQSAASEQEAVAR